MNLIWRAVYRFYRVMSLLIYWSQRRFTLAGWLVLAACFVTALAAVDTETLSAYQGYVLLLLLLVTSFVFSWFFRLKFSAVRGLPRFGTAGESFAYHVRIKNLSKKTQTDLTLLENPADPAPNVSRVAGATARRRKKSPLASVKSSAATVQPFQDCGA